MSAKTTIKKNLPDTKGTVSTDTATVLSTEEQSAYLLREVDEMATSWASMAAQANPDPVSDDDNDSIESATDSKMSDELTKLNRQNEVLMKQIASMKQEVNNMKLLEQKYHKFSLMMQSAWKESPLGATFLAKFGEEVGNKISKMLSMIIESIQEPITGETFFSKLNTPALDAIEQYISAMPNMATNNPECFVVPVLSKSGHIEFVPVHRIQGTEFITLSADDKKNITATLDIAKKSIKQDTKATAKSGTKPGAKTASKPGVKKTTTITKTVVDSDGFTSTKKIKQNPIKRPTKKTDRGKSSLTYVPLNTQAEEQIDVTIDPNTQESVKKIVIDITNKEQTSKVFTDLLEETFDLFESKNGRKVSHIAQAMWYAVTQATSTFTPDTVLDPNAKLEFIENSVREKGIQFNFSEWTRYFTATHIGSMWDREYREFVASYSFVTENDLMNGMKAISKIFTDAYNATTKNLIVASNNTHNLVVEPLFTATYYRSNQYPGFVPEVNIQMSSIRFKLIKRQ